MINRTLHISFLFLISAFLSNCKNNDIGKSDTPENGTIYISVDESFKPVIEEQIKMYESSFPNSHIIAKYKSEVDCFRDFFRDSSNRLIIVGRGLNSKEEHFMIDSLGYNPGCNEVASDAVTIIINYKNKDSLFTLASLKDQLQGKINRNIISVFDGTNATGTVRFIRDSVLKKETYDTSVVKALKNSREVIEFVSSHENSMGFVGISWIGNPEDSDQTKQLKYVKMAYVRNDICEGKPFVKPMQQSLITRRYPLVRPLYYIIKENYEGLGTGFTSFLKFERGQLIFKRAYLGTKMDFNTRNVQINQPAKKN